MSDLISRSAMLKRLQAWSGNDVMDKALYNFTFNRIMEQPTIEAVPVVHGEIVTVTDKYAVMHHRCSVCDEELEWQEYPNFCHNCGADLRKGGAE
jgi:hypothetical protein